MLKIQNEKVLLKSKYRVNGLSKIVIVVGVGCILQDCKKGYR